MEKFAGYGFNKSHSAAYALVAYHTAWLKTHYPAAFMAAVLSADMDNTDKVVTFIDECRELDLQVRPPDVNRCAYAFSVEDDTSVRYGLGAVKGAGESAIRAIIDEREHAGDFADLFDFCRRIDTRRANRRAIEALLRSGALDALGPNRASMMVSLTFALQAAEQHGRDAETGQNDLFGGAMIVDERAPRFIDAPEWPEAQRLASEKETLGLYLTGHPITRFERELDQITSARLVDLRPGAGASRVVAGLVVSMRSMNSRKGRMAVIVLDDRTARIEAVVYSDVFQSHRDLIVKDKLLVVEGEVSVDDFSGAPSMVVSRVVDLDGAREAYAKRLSLRLEQAAMGRELIGELASTLAPYRAGNLPVCIDYVRPDASVRMPLGDAWRVRPTEELLEQLRELTGDEQVRVEYS